VFLLLLPSHFLESLENEAFYLFVLNGGFGLIIKMVENGHLTKPIATCSLLPLLIALL
jgi:hypothetical protein